jgi:hypothetical protein
MESAFEREEPYSVTPDFGAIIFVETYEPQPTRGEVFTSDPIDG